MESTGMSAIDLYAQATPGFDDRLAQTLTVLHQAAGQFPDRVIQATSLGAEDMVITDLIARHGLPIAIGTLETGALHAETAALIGRIEQHYGVSVEVYRPVETAVIEFVQHNGNQAMYQSIALRKTCCGIRKLEPLARMLSQRSAWITGLRREQSNARGEAQTMETDDQGRAKLNPLVDWSWADVWPSPGSGPPTRWPGAR